MSRGVLVACPSCFGSGRVLTCGAYATCARCGGSRMIADSPAGAPDAEGEPIVSDGGTLYVARAAFKDAALNYAAARLMSHASADHVNRAFELLEKAAEELTRVKDLQKENQKR